MTTTDPYAEAMTRVGVVLIRGAESDCRAELVGQALLALGMLEGDSSPGPDEPIIVTAAECAAPQWVDTPTCPKPPRPAPLPRDQAKEVF